LCTPYGARAAWASSAEPSSKRARRAFSPLPLAAMDLHPGSVPVFKLELNPIQGCILSSITVESLRAR
jgi:hypothetical protein